MNVGGELPTMIENLKRDLHYAFRQIRRAPSFYAIAILTLAIGIAASTIIFSVINTVLLQPLPFPGSNRLVSIAQIDARRERRVSPASFPDFSDWRAEAKVFQGIAAHRDDTFTLQTPQNPIHVVGQTVSAEFFSVLGMQPLLGGDFTREDELPGHDTVVLSHPLWQTYYGSDPKIIGRAIRLSDRSFTVIGIAPPGFEYPLGSGAQVWTSMGHDAEGKDPVPSNRGARYLDVIARLRPDATIDQARQGMNLISVNLARQYPASNRYRTETQVELTADHLVSKSRPALVILFAAVGCLLLIACANVATLLLQRGNARRTEIAIRTSVGAQPWRIFRQLLTENILLWIIAAVVAFGVALGSKGLLVQLGTSYLPRLNELRMSGSVLGFSLGIALLTGLLFGLVPALGLSSGGGRSEVFDHSRMTVGMRGSRMQAVLLVSQIAITVMLLISASTLTITYFRLRQIDPGFEAAHLFTFEIDLPETRYDPSKQITFYEQLLERLGTLPGVEQASETLPLPLSGEEFYVAFTIEGRQQAPSDQPRAYIAMVGPRYFQIMRTPVVHGRDFNEHDRSDSEPVAVVNSAFARQFFPDTDPIGKRIRVGGGGGGRGSFRQIVGIAADAKLNSLDDPAPAQFYVPYEQLPVSPLRVLVRTNQTAAALLPAVRKEVHALDPELATYADLPMQHFVDQSTAAHRVTMVLLLLFAVTALLLTEVGLYGGIAYAVARRNREISIRIALGATGQNVIRMLLRNTVSVLTAGLLVGCAVAFALAHLLRAVVSGVGRLDPFTVATCAFIVAAVGLLATYIPARRARLIDPAVILRSE